VAEDHRTPGGLGYFVGALAILAAGPALSDGLGYEGAPPQELCGLCHGLNGISATSKFPNLAGQKREYVEKQLRDFLAGRRANDGGQMASIVTEIHEDEFKTAAAYFSALSPPSVSEGDHSLSAGEIERARSLFERGRNEAGLEPCASCHRETNDRAPQAPYLTAQHRDYLQKQLMDFKNGERSNDTTGTMQAVAAVLDESEIALLSTYLSTLPRARPRQ
jgi:cytochrome c553